MTRRTTDALGIWNVPLLIAPGESLEQIRATSLECRHSSPVVQARMGYAFGNMQSECAGADGIARIRVVGSLYRGFWWDDYAEIRQAIDEALASSDVRAVVLDIDSPGGQVSGCFELSDHVFASRGDKPIWAVCNDQATSAAYAIASAADRVLIAPTGMAGSIGVLATHMDWSEYDKKNGFHVTEIASGAKKTQLSRNKPLSEEGRQFLEAMVGELASYFFGRVAEYRSRLTVDAIREQEAGVYLGPQAVDAGLADGVATMEQAIEQLSAALPARTGTFTGLRAESPSPQEESMVDETTPQSTPAASSDGEQSLEDVRAEARQQSDADARARAQGITQICTLARAPELAGEFIAEGLTEEQVRGRLLARHQSNDDPETRSRHVVDVVARKAPRIDVDAVYARWNDPLARAKQVQRGEA